MTKKSEANERQLKALRVIAKGEGVLYQDIAKELLIGMQDARNMVKRLVDRGLVKKKQNFGVCGGFGSSHMGKIASLTITEQGEQFLSSLEESCSIEEIKWHGTHT